jgi:hypothetical protein
MITNLNIGYNGRFGNQIFQFASLIGIANKLGYKPVIPIQNKNVQIQKTMDGKSFNAKFELLDCFEIDDKYFSNDIIVNNIIKESQFNFDSKMFNISDFTAIDGYFQTDEYFKHCSDDIINILKFKESILKSAKDLLPNTNKELVSIHIRRGDYTTPNQYHPLIGKEYVDKAMKYFNNVHFIIFSDDKQWCETIWGGLENFTTFYSDSHFIDFCAMSLCDHNIISNSSFSWWASYLSKKENKKIIAPKSWFGPGFSDYILSDLYTEKMIII